MTTAAEDTLLAALRARLGADWVLTGADAAPFLTDQRRVLHGQALAVARPADADGVAAVLRLCHAARVPVVPQGGNTGLMGGATPDTGGHSVVLSLGRLNRVLGIDTDNDTITVQAGCVLAQVQEAASQAGRLFPLSLGSEGSCTIGGNLATNAGGTQVLRYGNARELTLGLEVVTAEGEVWNGLRGLRKDNTGYSLRDLYIGSEGTLGVITAATLKLYPKPAEQGSALAQARDGGNVKHDISVPVSRIPAFLQGAAQALHALDPGLRPMAFGHLGDGNLHYNVSHDPAGPVARLFANEARIHDLVHAQAHAQGGSISAEHGIGQVKRDALPHFKSPLELALMRRVKQALDPLNLMNPGKVLS